MKKDTTAAASADLRALAASLDLDAHRALSDAVAARKRAEAIDEAPFDSARFRERERERLDAERERVTFNLVARAYSRQRDALDAAALLAATLDAVEQSAREVERDLGATSRDLERACVVGDKSATAVAHCLAEIIPAISNAERLDAIAGDLAIALGDEDARATAAAILRILADAVNPRA